MPKSGGIPRRRLDIARRFMLILTAIAAPIAYTLYRAFENIGNKSAFFDELPPNYVEVRRTRGYFAEIRDITIGAILGAAGASYLEFSGLWGLALGGFLGYEFPPLEVVARTLARAVQIAAGALNGLLLGLNEAVYRIVRAFRKSPASITSQFFPLSPGWFKYGEPSTPRKPSSRGQRG